MTIYTRGNAAKQWIFEQLDARFGQQPFTVLDMGCGAMSTWPEFVASHPALSLRGIDTDVRAVEEGRKRFAGIATVSLDVMDAQRPMMVTDADVVVALSAIEHVVDRPAFLRTVWSALKPGGVAYLNYDVGHFRSRNLKERLMVPVSQVLARVGIEGPFMKRVNDVLFCSQAEAQGFRIVSLTKHNLSPLKGFVGHGPDEALQAWFQFESVLNTSYTADELDRVMWSTTLTLEKPRV